VPLRPRASRPQQARRGRPTAPTSASTQDQVQSHQRFPTAALPPAMRSSRRQSMPAPATSREVQTGRASDCGVVATARSERDTTDLADGPRPTAAPTQAHGLLHVQSHQRFPTASLPPAMFEKRFVGCPSGVAISSGRRQSIPRSARLRTLEPGELSTAVQSHPHASRARQARPSGRPAADSGADPSTRAAARAERPMLPWRVAPPAKADRSRQLHHLHGRNSDQSQAGA
jgi:hypothetical protein